MLVNRLCSGTIVPFVNLYKKQIDFNHCIAYDIMTKEISLILSTFLKDKRHKRGIITPLITGFIGLAYKGIYSFLHHKWQKALHKAFVGMEKKVDIQ